MHLKAQAKYIKNNVYKSTIKNITVQNPEVILHILTKKCTNKNTTKQIIKHALYYVPTPTCFDTKVSYSGSLLTTKIKVQHILQVLVALTFIIKIKNLKMFEFQITHVKKHKSILLK